MGSPERFVRITKHEARKRFNEDKMIVLCPHKMRPGGPWAQHSVMYAASIKEWKERADRYAPKDGQPAGSLWKGDANSTAWDLMYNDWAYYNTSYEQGYYAAYYVIEG